MKIYSFIMGLFLFSKWKCNFKCRLFSLHVYKLRPNSSLLFALDSNAFMQTVTKVEIQQEPTASVHSDQQTGDLTWRHIESCLVTDVLPRRVGCNAAVRPFILLRCLQDLKHPVGKGNEPVTHSRGAKIPQSEWVFDVIVLSLPRTHIISGS